MFPGLSLVTCFQLRIFLSGKYFLFEIKIQNKHLLVLYIW